MQHPQLYDILVHFSRECDCCLGSHIDPRQRTYRALLFGSQLKGTARPGSDIDILVIVDEELPNLWRQIKRAIAQLNGTYNATISAFCISKERYEWETTPFFRTLKREARTIDQFLVHRRSHESEHL